MALGKIIEMDSGIVVSYWRLAVVNVSYFDKRAHIRFDGYLSKEMRDTGRLPAEQRFLIIEDNEELEITHFTDVISNNVDRDIRQAVYEYVKTLPDYFSFEAEDV